MRMNRPVPYVLWFCAMFVAGCASLPNTVTEQIDNRHVEYVLTRNGHEIVVFENGLGGTMHWWAKVFPEIAKTTTSFAYNRPGYGKSDPASTPRDGQHIVNELRSLLRSKGLNPPYILVGHSLGGLYMQLFARRYPHEIQGLVLVDSTHPLQLKGAGSPENWPTWVRVVFSLATSAVAKEELTAIDPTGEEILGLPTVGNKPMIILSALRPMKGTSALAKDGNEKRKDLARLYPDARQIWVESDHGIPLENPESVVEAIREVLSQQQPNVQ